MDEPTARSVEQTGGSLELSGNPGSVLRTEESAKRKSSIHSTVQATVKATGAARSNIIGTSTRAADVMRSSIKDTSHVVVDASSKVLDTSGRVLHSTAKATVKATGAVTSTIVDTSTKAAEAVKSSIVDTSEKVFDTSGKVLHSTARCAAEATGVVGSTILDTSGKVLHTTAKAPALATKAVKKSTKVVKKSNKAYKETKLQALLRAHKNATKGKGRNFEKLQDLERHRRAILRKTEIGNPFLSLLFYEGAGVAQTMQDPALIFTLIIYVITRLLAHFKYFDDDKSDVFDHLQLGLFGGLLNLFQILFLQQNYSRFNQRFWHSMTVIARCQDITALARSSLDKWTAHRLVRYMNAAHIAGYVGLSRTYTTENFFDAFNEEWKLLNEQETQRIKEIDMDSGEDAYRELLVWGLTIIRDVYKDRKIDPNLATLFRKKILIIRMNLAAMFDFADQPLPFFFMYFVEYLQLLYLPLLAASIAFSTPVDPWSPFTEFVAAAGVVLGSFFTVGMRVFGYMIDDPYGDDLTDLSVLTYVSGTLKANFKILNAPDLAALDEEEEMRLAETRLGTCGSSQASCESSEIVFDEQEDETDQELWEKSRRNAVSTELEELSAGYV